MKNTNFSSLNKLAFCFSIFLIFLLLCSVAANATTENSQKCEVSVSRAEIKSEYGINGKSILTYDKSSITPLLGTFEFPGAYAEINVEIKNTGKLPVKLTNVHTKQPSIDNLELIMPDFTESECLAANESCNFSVIVRWNSDSVNSIENESSNFGFKILYENSESQATSDSAAITDNSSVKTGEFSFIFIALAVITVSFILFAALAYRRKSTN